MKKISKKVLSFFFRPFRTARALFWLHFLTNLLKTEDDDQGDDEDVGEDEDDDDEGKDGPTLADLYNAQEAGRNLTLPSSALHSLRVLIHFRCLRSPLSVCQATTTKRTMITKRTLPRSRKRVKMMTRTTNKCRRLCPI